MALNLPLSLDKTYITRDGQRVVLARNDQADYPFLIYPFGKEQTRYTVIDSVKDNGRARTWSTHDNDLVDERVQVSTLTYQIRTATGEWVDADPLNIRVRPADVPAGKVLLGGTIVDLPVASAADVPQRGKYGYVKCLHGEAVVSDSQANNNPGITQGQINSGQLVFSGRGASHAFFDAFKRALALGEKPAGMTTEQFLASFRQ